MRLRGFGTRFATGYRRLWRRLTSHGKWLHPVKALQVGMALVSSIRLVSLPFVIRLMQ
ncbi:hypothetical protein OH492_03275 [Vibrio chagasii]|nr:hypothetical protein [Vibrio chagasii]